MKLSCLSLVGARNRLQDLPLSQCRSDGMSGRAAEMQTQTGQTGGLRVVWPQSSEGNDGQNTRLVNLAASVAISQCSNSVTA